MSFKDEVREHGKFSLAWIWYTILFVVLLFGVAIATGLIKPAFLKLERKAFVESHQYVESQKAQLLTLAQSYRQAERDINKYKADERVTGKDFSDLISSSQKHRKSIFLQMRAKANLIPKNTWPEDVKNILLYEEVENE